MVGLNLLSYYWLFTTSIICSYFLSFFELLIIFLIFHYILFFGFLVMPLLFDSSFSIYGVHF